MRFERWFRRVIALVLLAVCGVTVWYTLSDQRLSAEREELLLSLDTAQGRLRKQQKEYDEVVAKLPAVLAELDRVQPLADAAKAEETELRAQRKVLRAEIRSLQEELSLKETEHEELAAIIEAIRQLS